MIAVYDHIQAMRDFLRQTSEPDLLRALAALSDQELRAIQYHFGLRPCPGWKECPYAAKRLKQWQKRTGGDVLMFEDRSCCECEPSIADQLLLPFSAHVLLAARLPEEPERQPVKRFFGDGYVREYVRHPNGATVWTGRLLPEQQRGPETTYRTRRKSYRKPAHVVIQARRHLVDEPGFENAARALEDFCS